MAEHPNQAKFLNLWNGFFGDKQKDLWERGAELLAPILVKAYLDTPIKRHLDGKITNPRIELAWVASNEAKRQADAAAQLELLKQLAKKQGAEIDYDKVGQASAKALAEYVKSVEQTTTVTLKEA